MKKPVSCFVVRIASLGRDPSGLEAKNADNFAFMNASYIAFSILILTPVAPLSAVESKTWQQFVTSRKEGTEPILPDFSFAGYHGGVDAIPDIKGPIFDVTQYGAKGDGRTDDQDAIQKTIDAAEAAGGGVVFFPVGTFLVNVDMANRRPILVRKGSIVLRGSGATKGGTMLLIDEPTLKVKAGAESDTATESESGEAEPDWMIQVQPEKEAKNRKLGKVVGDTPREAFTLALDKADKIKPGMWVTLYVKGKAMVPDVIAPYTESDLSAEWTRIHKSGLSLQEHHLVKSVDGNQVTLREPVKTAIKASHGWTVSEYQNIAEVGIEDICFVGGWVGKFVHHRSHMDDNGWCGLKLFNVVDSWVRRCAFINFNACIGAESSAYTSVMEVVLAGTMGHVSIDAHRRSTGMFFGLMEDRMEHQGNLRDTTHGIGAAGSAVATVFWRYTMQPKESFDMHGAAPYATLFDAVEGGNFSGSGGPVPSFPNHLKHFVAWNFNQRVAPAKFANKKGEYDFWGGRPSLVMPIIVGMHGKLSPLNEKTVSIYESPGKAVEPASLFEAQLALRFGGKCPAWVAEAQAHWSKMNKDLPNFPHSGDNTPWVAKKRAQIIQMILDTPMVKKKLDKDAILKEWPTNDGKPWVKPDSGGGMEGFGFMQ